MRLLVVPMLLALWGCGAAPGHPPRVLLVGLDGADWDVIDPLAEAGLLPTIGGLVAWGARADLDCAPAFPQFACFCPPVWTSLATGRPLADHRMGAVESRADARPVEALWTLNGARGGVSVVVGYRNTWPLEEEVALGLSEPGTWAAALELHDVWGSPYPHPGLDQPETLAKPADLLAVLRLLPVRRERRPAWLPMASDRVSMDAMEGLAFLARLRSELFGGAELTMVLLHGIDKSEHVAWGSVQATRSAPVDAAAVVSQGEAWTGPVFIGAPFGFGTVASQYMEAERWLTAHLARFRYDYVVLASDHGMARNPGEGLSGVHSIGTPEAHAGVLSITGPGVRPGAVLAASVLDVAPTVAYLLDLPVATDLPGRLLVEAFTPARLAARPPVWVPSWQ